jgi:hypothetical protein
MNREKVKWHLKELDQEIPQTGALLRIHKQRRPYGNVLIGNETGLLRFGLESMRKATNSKSRKAGIVEDFDGTELDYLQGDELEMYRFWRDDAVEKLTLEQSKEETRLNFNSSTRFFIYCFLSLFIVFIFIGVYTSVNWLFRFF